MFMSVMLILGLGPAWPQGLLKDTTGVLGPGLGIKFLTLFLNSVILCEYSEFRLRSVEAQSLNIV